MRETDKALLEYGYKHVFGSVDTHHDYSVWQKGPTVLLRDNRNNEVLSVNTLATYGDKRKFTPNHPTKTTYVVDRNCCTSGQCVACRHLPRGAHVKVEQTRTHDKVEAEQIAGNWREYGAVVREEQLPVRPYESDPRD